MPLSVEVVTAERSVLSDTADMVMAPSVEGIVGILPHHAPMIAILGPGELRLKKASDENVLAISGGLMQVEPERVIVLADAAERVDEIDEARARQALERAREAIGDRRSKVELLEAQAAIQRATARLRVAERRKRRRQTGGE